MSRTVFLVGLICVAFVAKSQKIYRGIVADSLTMANIPGVYIQIKNKNQFAVADSQGHFIIRAQATDTLVFRLVGYRTKQIPLLFEEDALFILLAENPLMLSEIEIRGWRLYPDSVKEKYTEKVRTLPKMSAFFSPFDYFWKLEREKRKLNRIIDLQNKTQVYVQVISNPKVTEIMMRDHHLTEEKYYKLLAKFNTEMRLVQYYSDADEIMIALHEYLDKQQ